MIDADLVRISACLHFCEGVPIEFLREHTMSKLPTAPIAGVRAWLTELRSNGFSPNRILDIGGGIGKFAGMMHLMFPEAHVTSIEANPNCRDALTTTADETHMVLLSDEPGERTYYVCGDNVFSEGNSYYRERGDWFTNPIAMKMPATTLSLLLAGKEPYDLVKLDTQGSELDIIRGGREIIAAAKYVLCEMPGPEPYNQGAPPMWHVDYELRSLGFVNSLVLEWWNNPANGELINQDWAYWKSDGVTVKPRG